MISCTSPVIASTTCVISASAPSVYLYGKVSHAVPCEVANVGSQKKGNELGSVHQVKGGVCNAAVRHSLLARGGVFFLGQQGPIRVSVVDVKFERARGKGRTKGLGGSAPLRARNRVGHLVGLVSARGLFRRRCDTIARLDLQPSAARARAHFSGSGGSHGGNTLRGLSVPGASHMRGPCVRLKDAGSSKAACQIGLFLDADVDKVAVVI